MTENKSGLYLEDLAIGQKYMSGSFTMDEHHIKSFARDYDPQPFHMDDSAAQKTLFGGLVASGWHTAAVTMKLLVASGVPLANGVVGVNADVTWPMPVRAGDVLRVSSEIIEIKPSRSHDDRGIVAVRSETLNQKNEVAQILVAKLLVFRRPKST